MKQFWVHSCLALAEERAEFYSGARKIIRRVRLKYDYTSSRFDSLRIEDAGFTKSKLSMLRRNYLVPESISAAKKLWVARLEQDKYGSVGFSCYGHYVKGDVKGATPRGSKMGPCLQSVTLTLHQKRMVSIDVFYRTTELFKKFPADLVFLRDELLLPFKLGNSISDIAFHFANVTIHPMYAITVLPHLSDPVAWLEKLRRRDPYFYDWVVKWSARYICEEYSRGILKFSQALRVRKDALERLDKRTLKDLQKYVRKNHPGYRGDKEDDDTDE